MENKNTIFRTFELHHHLPHFGYGNYCHDHPVFIKHLQRKKVFLPAGPDPDRVIWIYIRTHQLANYSLLLGSIGLALILAATIYFTRNINWYELSMKSE